ncbi:MAG: T9SS type A sorting domain-containing protein, partial [bacterium]
QDGIVWGAKAYADASHTQPAPFGQTIRVGGASYGTGCRAGWVEGFGATAVQVSRDDPRARIWRIRRDYKLVWERYMMGDPWATAVVLDDASTCWEIPVGEVDNDQVEITFGDLDWCWNNWPVDLGAPFIDRNGDGVYTPPPPFNITGDPNDSAFFGPEELMAQGFDEPGIAGADHDLPADQVIWAVWNDLYRNLRFGSEPTGLEVQQTMWGYARTDAMGNVFFRKVRVINKGGVEIDAAGTKGVFWLDSMYMCQWSDPDLGHASDDLVGCDTLLHMGFVYNSNAVDLLYRDFNLPPPAGGYDILQGPAIYTGDPINVAVFDLKYKQGYKNLGMAAFSYEAPGDPYSEPSNTVYSRGAILWYKMLRGFASMTGPDRRHFHPPGVVEGPYPLAGDPVTGTGHIDGWYTGYSFGPSDKSFICSTGPFQMAPGDTQEFVVALVCGLGSDRLSSISVMKHNDRYIQSVFSSLLSFPVPPKSPSVKIAEMDGKVILEWGSDSKRVADIEEKTVGLSGFRFEGYNVYQLLSANSTKSEALRIATFDRVTDPAVILEETYDSSSGQILLVPAQFGSNCGVRREFVFDRDYLRDIDKLYNGTDYYLAVTAYSIPADGFFETPSSLESSLRPIKVVPQSRGFGIVMGSEYHQTIEPVVHTRGSGSAEITPIIIDPFSILPATYTVSWDPDSTWKVSKEGTTLVDGLTHDDEDGIDPIVDGVMVKVRNVTFTQPVDFTKYTVIPSSNADQYRIGSFYTQTGHGSARSVDTWGYGTTDLALLQCDIELRFTGVYGDKEGSVIPIASGGQMATIYKANTMADHPLNPNPGSDERFVLRIPFEVWDVERNMQINIIMRDRIQQATDDPFYAFNPNDRMHGWLNALPYKETTITESDEMQNTWNLVFWKTQWQTGDVIRIEYANPIIPGSDEFTYSTHGYENKTDEKLKKQDVHRIGVFPNPYYAFNPLEKNKFDKFVTFNNLPPRASIRIFTLSGHLIKRIDKDDDSPFVQWDLRNHFGRLVASGMYLVHVDIPDEGLSTVLKLAVIQEEEFLDVY